MDSRNLSGKLIIANQELALQNQEKAKLAAELILVNIELDFQNEEKAKRAAELVLANIELDFQNEEKAKRAAELIIANKELDFQNKEKDKRANELIIANKELIFQNEEKEKRAAELIIANTELIFQNKEKEKRAAELIIANTELLFQNREKEKRANELIIANEELVFQNQEKERRAEAEAKKDEFFNMVSHELKTPLTYIKAINQMLGKTLSKADKSYPFVIRANHIVERLERLIEDLLDVTRINSGNIDLNIAEFDFTDALTQSILSVQQISHTHEIKLENSVNILYSGDQFRIERVLINLLNNAIKYSPGAKQVVVKAYIESDHIVVSVNDFGIGIEKEDIDQLFKDFSELVKQLCITRGLAWACI